MSAEDLLARTLHEVAESVDPAPVSFPEVSRRARAVRARRRRWSGVAAAAAVATIAGSGTLWLTRSPALPAGPAHHGSGPVAPATTSGGRAPAVALGSLARGPRPAVDFVRDGAYVSVGGHVTPLPVAGVTGAAPYLGGFLVQHARAGTASRLTWLDNTMRSRWTACGSQLTPSADGTLLAFVTGGCAGGTSVLHLGIPSGMSNTEQSRGISGAVTLAGLARGAWVYMPGGGGVLVAQPGGAPRRVPVLATAGAVDPTGSYVAGQSATDPSTGVLVDLSTGKPVWQRAGHLGSFTADGTLLLDRSATDARRYAVLDAATGAVVGSVAVPPGLALTGPLAWVGDGSLLGVLRDRPASGGAHNEAIARFGIHGGRPTLATPLLRVRANGTGYVLAARYP